MSSSDSDSSSSSECSTGWPWQCGGNCIHSDSDEYDSSPESSSEDSGVEDISDDLWTNRRNIFISVNSNNLKATTLITNYNELHNYRDKYTKLSKKSADNIKNIWSEVKVNVPDLGIIPLKSYEKELVEDTKTKKQAVKKPASVSKENDAVTSKTKSPAVRQNQSSKTIPKPEVSNQVNINVVRKTDSKTQTSDSNVVNKNTKESNSNVKAKNKENEPNQKNVTETPTKTAKSTERNKVQVNNSIKVNEKDKGVKVDLVVLNVTKSESDKKNVKTNSTVTLNGNDKNAKNNSKESEFKKPQVKSESNKNKNGKNNSKEIIPTTKSKKQKKKSSSSQCSDNGDAQKRSRSADSSTKIKAKQKIKESESEADDEDEDEEIIDNMDELTGAIELVKSKEKKKPVETPKAADKKISMPNTNEVEKVTPPESPVQNDLSPLNMERNYVYYSEKFAEDAVDMMMENNLMGSLEFMVEAMHLNPGDDRHYLNRCYCYLRLNRPALALADAQYVLQTSSHLGHRFIANLRAGQASMALQRYTQAETHFKDSLSINPDNMYALREYMRAKISRIVSIGYTERNAVLTLLKYSKTQEAINYLANKKFANNENESNEYSNFDDTNDLDDLVYSSDEDEKPNCTTLINNMLNYEPLVNKLYHLLAKPVGFSKSTSALSGKTTNGDNKNKNLTSIKSNTGRVMDRAIWVGNLKKHITDAILKKHFKQFGNIVSVYIPPNEAYGFVNFEKSEHVTNVLKNPTAYEMNGIKLAIRQGVYKK